MGMIVQHNMQSLNANRNLGVTTSQQAKSTEKLSSGYKINRAGDDAAGLAISEKMRGQIRGLNKASSNAQDGVSLIQTAEGALTETHSIIQRMRELAVQSSSDTNTDDDRTQIQNEIDQLTQEVDRIANTTEFNTKKLLNGDQKGAVSEKEGTYSVEGTFTNSMVKVGDISSTDTMKLAKGTNVIRIEFLADKGEIDGSSVQKDLNGAEIDPETNYTYSTQLLHNTTGAVDEDSAAGNMVMGDGQQAFGVTFEAGVITISGTAFGTNEEAINLKEDGEDVTINIDNWENIKAGDVITITLNEAVQTEQAATGKDALRLQVGANAGQEVALGINSMRTQDLDIANKETGKGLDVSNQNGASLAINAYDMAIQKVSTERAKMGAMQNRLEHTIANLDSAAENTQSSESRIRDTDMASEMVEYSKNNILAQAGQSMLAQANQSTQGVLSLLG
jgi:flagellin